MNSVHISPGDMWTDPSGLSDCVVGHINFLIAIFNLVITLRTNYEGFVPVALDLKIIFKVVREN